METEKRVAVIFLVILLLLETFRESILIWLLRMLFYIA